VSFLGRPTTPSDKGERTQGGDNERDHNDRDEIARGSAAGTPMRRGAGDRRTMWV